MSEYEIFYSTADAELECGWYWHARCVGPALETVWIEGRPFATAEEARADAEQEFEEDDPEPAR